MFKFIVSIGRPSHNLWFASWKFRCDVCGKFMAFKKTRNDMHKHCQKEYYDELAEAERYMREQDALADDQLYALDHLEAVLDSFCGHYGCWAVVLFGEKFCLKHNEFDDDDYFDDSDHDYYDDEPDEDPLAGDIDDGSNYIPEPSPLDTQHYFALKQRGYI